MVIYRHTGDLLGLVLSHDELIQMFLQHRGCESRHSKLGSLGQRANSGSSRLIGASIALGEIRAPCLGVSGRAERCGGGEVARERELDEQLFGRGGEADGPGDCRHYESWGEGS